MSYFPEAIDVIADACRQIKGARFQVLDGARTRGYKGRTFKPLGQMNHHTGKGSWSGLTHWITKGSSIAPLANAMTSNPDETDGICIVQVVACGRANHAGRGIWTPDVPEDSGNALLWGWEHQNDGGSPWHPLHNEVILSLNIAMNKAFDWKPHNVMDHKSYAPGRKVDRYNIDPEAWREKIVVRLSGKSVVKGEVYTVQSGDTLASIAGRAGGIRWQDIYNANKDKISDPNVIRPGQKLDIPTGTVKEEPKEENKTPLVYTVKKGDTLRKIGDHFDMEWQEIYRENRDKISNPNVIKVGQRFVIPGRYKGEESKPEEPKPEPKPQPKPEPEPKSFAERMPLVSKEHNRKGLLARIGQGLLVAAGYAPRNTIRSDGSLDGVFGSGTEAAVKAFQKAKSLKQDGILGPNTWSALIGRDSVIVSQTRNKRGIRARRVQGLLVAHNVTPGNGTIQSDGSLDGIFGSGTEAAVKTFQRRKGLKVDGIVGPNTREALLALN